MYGRGITNNNQFVREVSSNLWEFMRIDGYKSIFEKYIEPLDQDIFFSKIIDRRVMGSMNDLVFQAKMHLSMGNLSPADVSFRLNESPMSYLNYGRRMMHLGNWILRKLNYLTIIKRAITWFTLMTFDLPQQENDHWVICPEESGDQFPESLWEGFSGGYSGMTIGPIPSTFNFLIFSHQQAIFSWKFKRGPFCLPCLWNFHAHS